MTQHKIVSSLAVFDYANNKLCDLYDSQNDLAGQAFGIAVTTSINDGVKTLSFSIPYMVDKKRNFRWQYLKSEYQIRYVHNGKTDWFIAQKPEKRKEKGGIYGELSCAGSESLLKTKNIYMEFDDENGIGTVSYLAGKILAGTGWHLGHVDPMLEADGTTEKVRSIKSGNKTGALGLMTTVCNLFRCYPIYDSDTKTVSLYNYNNRSNAVEGTVGINLDSLKVDYNSSDIITRLYVEGEYAEDGYIGIDSVNPTGLSYIMNFDYYRELGLFTSVHETALSTYLTNILDVKNRISANTTSLLEKENNINNLIGQCKLVVYYSSSGFVTPAHVYGDMTAQQKALSVGDDVLVLHNNGRFDYATIVTTAAALVTSSDYGIAKFVTKSAGTIGAYETQIEAKEKEIANLQRKINSATKQEVIAEYTANIATLQGEIQDIKTKTNGLYNQMHSVVKTNGLLHDLDGYYNTAATLSAEQDDIESDFIIAMGDMLRDGYWNDKNYVEGQEQALYDDAVEHLKILSRPIASYSFGLVRLHDEFGIPIEDFDLNWVFRVHDDELDVHDNLFITSIRIGVDNEADGSVEVSNKDITLNSNDLGSLLSRISQLSDLIEQKNTLYDRAQAISKNGTIFVDRLNGQIDVLKNQIKSTVSNWYTDEMGNIIFLAADGGSAMMLSGAGFMIANSKDNSGDWNWRTFGTGEGFTADEIVAGFISAERIEAGSIAVGKLEANVGSSLVIANNPSITQINGQIAPEFDASQSYTKNQIVTKDGIMYVFKQNHTGAWNPSHVEQTKMSAQIEVLPGRIEQIVSTNFAPAFSTGTAYSVGDIVSYDGKMYRFKTNHAAGAWNASHVDQVDTTVAYLAQTAQYQTADAIVNEAVSQAGTSASGTYVTKTQTLQTADAIVTEAKKQATANFAPAFSTSTSYAVGDIVSYNGKIYKFKKTHSAGAWNSSHVDEITSTDAYIQKTSTLQTADQIVTEAVSQAGTAASGLYIEKTQTIQTAEQILTEATKRATKNVAPEFSTSTTYAAGDLVSYNGKVYRFKTAHPAGAWNNSHVDEITSAEAYIQKTSTLQTADAIVNEAVSRAGTSASGLYIAKTQTIQTADEIVTEATKQSTINIAPEFKTSKAYVVGDIVTYNGKLYKFKAAHAAGAWNSSHVDAVTTVGTYIAKTTNYQTADAIVLAAEAYTDDKAYKKVSGITINPAGVDISGSQYVKIASGGYLDVRTGNFGIATNGKDSSEYVIWSGAETAAASSFWVKNTGAIYATSGKIGGWNMGANVLYSGSGAGYVALDSNTSDTYAIWAGAASAASAPFSVSRAGEMHATSGNIAGWTINSKNLSVGSGNTTICLNADTTSTDVKDYAMWVGLAKPSVTSNGTTTVAPFSVKRDGTVTLTKLLVANENGTTRTINLSDKNATYPLWKLNYSTIKSWSVFGGTVTIETTGGTINFNRASSLAVGSGAGRVFVVNAGSEVSGTSRAVVVGIDTEVNKTYSGGYVHFNAKAYFSSTGTSTNIISSPCQIEDKAGSGLAYDAGKAAALSGVSATGGWEIGETSEYKVTVTDGSGSVIDTESSGAVMARTNAQIKSDLENASNHIATLAVYSGGSKILERKIDASGVYAQGKSAGAAGVTHSGTWTDNWTRYTVTAKDANGNTLWTHSSGAVTADKTNAQIKSAIESASNHSTTLTIEADGEDILVRTINASGVYTAGSTAGYNSAKLSGSWNGAVWTVAKGTTGTNSVSLTLSARATISYDPTTHKYTATGYARASNANRATSDPVPSGTEAYDAGVTAGNTAGYNSAKLSGSWNGKQWLVTKGTTGSNQVGITISAGISYDSTTHKYTAKANADGTLIDSIASGTQAYEAGQKSVTAATGKWSSGSRTITLSSPNTHTYTITIPDATNWVITNTAAHTISVSCKVGGKEMLKSWANLGYVNDHDDSKIGAAASISYDPTTHKYTAGASATYNNVEKATDSKTSGTEAYIAGQKSVTASTGKWSEGSRTIKLSSPNTNTYTVTIPDGTGWTLTNTADKKALASVTVGGKTLTKEFTYDWINHGDYENGWSDSYSAIGLSATSSTATYGQTITVYARGKATSGSSAANITAKKFTYTVPPDRYNDGISAYYNSSYWAPATAANNWTPRVPNVTNTASEAWPGSGASDAFEAGKNGVTVTSVTLGRWQTGTVYNCSVLLSSGLTRGGTINCATAYSDARSGYTAGTFTQYSGATLYTMGQSGPQVYSGTLYVKS